MNLHRERVGIEAVLGRKGFDDGGEEIEQRVGAVARFRFLGVRGNIAVVGRGEHQRHRPFHDRFLLEQHAAHISVLDDGDLRVST